MINSITIQGNMGVDPEKKEGDTRTRANGRMAVGQGRDKPSIWFDLVAWSQWAIEDLMRAQKGDKVIVSGRLTLREWEDRQGGTKQQLGISCDSIVIVQKSKVEPAAQPESDDADQIPW